MISQVDQIIQKVPQWKAAKDIHIEQLAGLTNTNYSVTVDGERFVLRISGKNTTKLGINRELEIKAHMAASRAGIAPQVVYSFLPDGHLVTRYINGRHLTLEEYRKRENIQRIVATVKRLHALPHVEAVFSPFNRVNCYAVQAQEMGVPFPSDFERMREKMRVIERDQAEDTSPWLCFCHNDLFSVNVIDDGMIWFVDWEFAGTGDIYYDLATLFYAYDSADSLPPELQEYLLACYFGEVRSENWRRVKGMQYMIMFYSAMWGLLQHGLFKLGHVRSIEGFSYMGYAETTFESMRKFQ